MKFPKFGFGSAETPDKSVEDANIISETPKETLHDSLKEGGEIKGKTFEERMSSFESLYKIGKEELESIPAFKGLSSEGQKALVLENFSQFGFQTITERAIIRQQEEKGKANLFGKVFRGIFADQYLKGAEKKEVDAFLNDDPVSHLRTIEWLAMRAKEGNVETVIDSNGSLKSYFIPMNETELGGLGPEERAEFAKFNEAARAFSETPAEWQYGGRKQREFANAKKRYEESLNKVIDIKALRASNKEEVLLNAAQTDKTVRTHQLLNTNQDVEKKIRSIASESSVGRLFRSAASQNVGMAAMGYGVRTATVGAFGLLATPFVAMGLGWFMSRKRAIRELKQEAVLARGGKETKITRKAGKEKLNVLNFVSADNLTKKLEKLTDKVTELENTEPKSETIEKEIEKLREEIASRVFYTELKMEQGLVNYGALENRLGTQYALLKAKAFASFGIMGKESKPDKVTNERLISFLEMKDDKAHTHVRKAAIRGAVMGATFSLLGYEIRDMFHGFQGTKNAAEFIQNLVKGHAASANSAGLGDVITIEKAASADTTYHPIVSEENIKKAESMGLISKAGHNTPRGNTIEIGSDDQPKGSSEKEIFDNYAKKDVKAPKNLADLEKEAKINLPEKDIMKAATIGRGEGVEHAFRRQLEMNPKEFGYAGDPANKAAIHEWSGREAHRIAIDKNYVNFGGTGKEVRVLDMGPKGPEGNPAYVLKKDPSGKIVVKEYFQGMETENDGGGAVNQYEYTEKPGTGGRMIDETQRPSIEALGKRMAWGIEPDLYDVKAPRFGMPENAVNHTEGLPSWAEIKTRPSIDNQIAMFKKLSVGEQEGWLANVERLKQLRSDRISEFLDSPEAAGKMPRAEVNKIYEDLDNWGRDIAKLREEHLKALQLTPNHEAVKIVPEQKADTIPDFLKSTEGPRIQEINSFIHGLAKENLNELKDNIPDYAIVLKVEPKEVEKMLLEIIKSGNIVDDLDKMVAEPEAFYDPRKLRLLQLILDSEQKLEPGIQEVKGRIDALLAKK
jgi:hypothetical protein